MRELLVSIKEHVKSHYIEIFSFVVLTFFSVLVANYMLVQRETSRVFDLSEAVRHSERIQADVGIVFGGAIYYGEPRPVLEQRLRTAKQLLDDGVVNKLLLSGDNRFIDYNEPVAMYNYLTEDLGVNPSRLALDYAGRSTYETCERAKKVFSVNNAILISEKTHLPRALYLCKTFGITAYGVASGASEDAELELDQNWREIWARSKAIFNVYVYGEDTILGEQIEL